MGNNSKIEWLFGGTTWNPVGGCSPESSGCLRCYAARMATRMKNDKYQGLAAQGIWTGEVRFWPDELKTPLSWTRKPKVVFLGSMTDLFKSKVSNYVRDRIFAVVALCSVKEELKHHKFIVLSKRAWNMQQYFSDGNLYNRLADMVLPMPDMEVYQNQIRFRIGPIPNLCLGISVENNEMLKLRLPYLLQTPTACNFLSFEPLLGKIDRSSLEMYQKWDRIDWVACGGETGHHARPMHPDWVRSLRDTCVDLEIPFLFKKWGNKPNHEGVGVVSADLDPICILDGRQWLEAPEWINFDKNC
jgi:protein gp37